MAFPEAGPRAGASLVCVRYVVEPSRAGKRDSPVAPGKLPTQPPAPKRFGRFFGQVAQLVEHATENRGVGGSIPPLAIYRLTGRRMAGRVRGGP